MKFELTEVELQKYKEWAESHECVYRKQEEWMSKPFRYTGAIGGADEFRFTPTSIGTVIQVKCACGAVIDLTDYNLW